MTRMLGFLVSMLLVGNLGCQSFSSFELPSFLEEKAPSGKPNEIAAMWQDGVDVQLDPNQGGLASPGFAGRVVFMEVRNGKPAETVAVDGTLIVKLYEDKPYQGPPTPMETWTILPEHMPGIMRRDLSGWGYVLWLPWSSYNRNLRSARLTVEFHPKDGSRPLQGEPTKIELQNRRGGLPKPTMEVKTLSKNTWQ
jgi:hypothetical protein